MICHDIYHKLYPFCTHTVCCLYCNYDNFHIITKQFTYTYVVTMLITIYYQYLINQLSLDNTAHALSNIRPPPPPPLECKHLDHDDQLNCILCDVLPIKHSIQVWSRTSYVT